MVTALLAVVTLILIGLFWRQAIIGVSFVAAGTMIIALVGLLAWGVWSLDRAASGFAVAGGHVSAQPGSTVSAGAPVTRSAGTAVWSGTAALTASQRAVIGAYVRRCWTDGSGVPGASRMQVMLEVTTDADGMARIVQFAPSDEARMDGDPAFRRFAERARRAVFDPRCMKLSLPNDMLGKVNVLDFRFSP